MHYLNTKSRRRRQVCVDVAWGKTDRWTERRTDGQANALLSGERESRERERKREGKKEVHNLGVDVNGVWGARQTDRQRQLRY